MRFMVSGPVLSIFCLPTRPNFGSTPACPRRRPGSEARRAAQLLLECGILGIIGQFGLFLGVEVVEVAEQLVEAVHGRQKLVAVAQVILAELAGRVTERLEDFGDASGLPLKPDRRAGHADFRDAGADRLLAGDERGAAGGAALLSVIVGEQHAFVGDAVDVRRAEPIMPC